MKFTISFLFIVSFLFSNAQTKHQLIPQTPENFYCDTLQMREYKTELRRRALTYIFNLDLLNEYLERTTGNEILLQENGLIYTWPEAKIYLEKVVKTILKDKWSEKMTVSVIRDPGQNFFMFESGKINVNVGLLASLGSEAELAALIAHEYGHFSSKHDQKSLVKNREVNGRPGMNPLYEGNVALPSRTAIKVYYLHQPEYETQADQIALDLLKASGYNLKEFLIAVKKIQEEEKKSVRSKGKLTEPYFNFHQSNSERISSLEKEIKKTDSTGKQDFIVDKAVFTRIKQQAIDEAIYYHFKNYDFYHAIELCYAQLMYDPGDEHYLFFINEALRRYLEVSPQIADKYFITDQYKFYEKYVQKKDLPKVSLSKSVNATSVNLSKLVHYNFPFVIFKNQRTEIPLPKNYLTTNDTIEFATYKEALAFFMTQQEKLGHSSVCFTRSMMGNSGDCNIQSDNPIIKNYKKILEDLKKPKANDSVTVIPFHLNYNNNTKVLMWGYKVSGTKKESFTSEVLNSLSYSLDTRYKLFNDSLIEEKERFKFENDLKTLESFGISFAEIEKHYLDHKGNYYEYELYKPCSLKVNSINPELGAYLRSIGIGKVIYLHANVEEYTQLGGSASFWIGPQKMYGISGFYFDPDNNGFYHSFHWRRESKEKNLSYGLAKEINNFVGQLIKDVEERRTNYLRHTDF